MHVLPQCYIVFTNITIVPETPGKKCSLRFGVLKRETRKSSVLCCQQRRTSEGELWGEAAEIFKLTITVSSFHKVSPQVTLFNASQMFWSHGKIYAEASDLLCKLVSYHQVTAYKDQFVLFLRRNIKSMT